MTIIVERGKDRHEMDYYETPQAFAATALYHIPCQSNFVKTALDPGTGRGVWGKALRLYNTEAMLEGVEIQPFGDIGADVDDLAKAYNKYWHDDFLTWKAQHKYDLIMGNPPYKLAHEFVDKCLDLLAPNGQLIFLLRLAMLESQKRYKTWWTYSPIKKVIVSPKRISFTGDGRSDDTAYALFVWQNGWDGNVTLDWMWWDYDIIPQPPTISGWDIDGYPEWHYKSIEKEG
jgi:hypothetical protein